MISIIEMFYTTDFLIILNIIHRQGTSAQIVRSGGWIGQKLFFNLNGERASFYGERLSDNRRARGVALEGAMSEEEKQQNMILVIQVPLKQTSAPLRLLQTFFGTQVDEECFQPSSADSFTAGAAPSSSPLVMAAKKSISSNRGYSEKEEERSDVEEAILRIGESEGKFDEVGDIEIERDPAFPVRVTLQFYKSTASGVIDDEVMRTIAGQLEAARKNADFVGSLVVGGQTGRVTEHHGAE
jgi:hypothetical protein